MSDLRNWLERTALDSAFRALAERDPDASFEGYDLEDDAKQILRRRDESLLSLLKSVLADLDTPAPEPAATLDLHTRAPSPELPDTRLYLHLEPRVSQDGNIQHAATLLTQPPDDGAGGATFAIQVSALLDAQENGNTALTYDATLTSAHPIAVEANAPWGHRVDSARARQAAEAVLDAPPEERRAHLVALVEALTS